MKGIKIVSATPGAVAIFLAAAGVVGASEYLPPEQPSPPVSTPIKHGTPCLVPKFVGRTLPDVWRGYKQQRGVPWCGLGRISGDRSGVVVRQSKKPYGLWRIHITVDIALRARERPGS